jgi:hypothetical protein
MSELLHLETQELLANVDIVQDVTFTSVEIKKEITIPYECYLDDDHIKITSQTLNQMKGFSECVYVVVELQSRQDIDTDGGSEECSTPFFVG